MVCLVLCIAEWCIYGKLQHMGKCGQKIKDDEKKKFDIVPGEHMHEFISNERSLVFLLSFSYYKGDR